MHQILILKPRYLVTLFFGSIRSSESLLRFQYQITLPQKVAENRPICGNPLSRSAQRSFSLLQKRLLYGFCTGASAVRYSVDNSSTQVKFRRIHVELSEHNWANISETVAPKCLFLTRGPLGRCSSRIS